MSNTPRTDAIAHRGYHLDALAARSIDLCRELERENAALRAEVNVTRKNYADYQTDNIALRSALDQQANYQRELRADRDRLDWLARNRSVSRIERPLSVTPESLRAAIDAARKEAQP